MIPFTSALTESIGQQLLIYFQIIHSHPPAGKTPFKDFSAELSIKELNLLQCSDRLFGRFNDESRQSGIDNFWNRTCPIRNDWRATRYRSIITSPNGSGQSIGNSSASHHLT